MDPVEHRRESIYQTCMGNNVWGSQLSRPSATSLSLIYPLVELALAFSPLAISHHEGSWQTVTMDINKIKWDTKKKKKQKKGWDITIIFELICFFIALLLDLKSDDIYATKVPQTGIKILNLML